MFTDPSIVNAIQIIVEITFFFVLLLCSALFSSSETSLFSLAPAQLEKMKHSGNTSYPLIQRMLNEPRKLIVTILIGNEFVNITATVLSATLVIRIFGAEYSFLNLLVVTPLLLFFGEITPKTLAIKNNIAFATFEAPLINRFSTIITPIRIVIRMLSESIITLFVGKERTAGSLVTQDMVLTLAREAVGDGVLDTREAFYIHQVFKFGEAKVEEVMTPRSNITFLAHDARFTEIVKTIKASAHSKIPVYKTDQDSISGILFARDLLRMNVQSFNGKKGLGRLLRKPYFVPGSRLVIDLFHHFRSEHLSMAIVLDEYGGVIGLVTMDDLLRCIFGDLPGISANLPADKVSNDEFVIDPAMPVHEFNRNYNATLPTDVGNTINGLLMHHHGELPKKNDKIAMQSWLFTVIQVHSNMIQSVRVRKNTQNEVKNPVKAKSKTRAVKASAAKKDTKNGKSKKQSKSAKSQKTGSA